MCKHFKTAFLLAPRTLSNGSVLQMYSLMCH